MAAHRGGRWLTNVVAALFGLFALIAAFGYLAGWPVLKLGVEWLVKRGLAGCLPRGRQSPFLPSPRAKLRVEDRFCSGTLPLPFKFLVASFGVAFMLLMGALVFEATSEPVVSSNALFGVNDFEELPLE